MFDVLGAHEAHHFLHLCRDRKNISISQLARCVIDLQIKIQCAIGSNVLVDPFKEFGNSLSMFDKNRILTSLYNRKYNIKTNNPSNPGLATEIEISW